MKSFTRLLRVPGLRVQLMAWYLAIVLGMLVLAGGVFYVALKVTLDTRVDAELSAEARRVSSGISLHNGVIVVQDVSGSLPGLGATNLPAVAPDAGTAIWVRALSPNGTVIYTSPAFQGRILPDASLSAPLAGQEWRDSLRIGGVAYVRFLSVPLEQGGRIYGVLQVGQSLALVTTTLSISAVVLAALAPLLLALGAWGAWWLSGRAFAPVRRLTDLATRVQAGGDLRQRVPVPVAHDDVRQLALTLNAMLGRLDAAFTAQRRFIADASHDLRAPVAALLSAAENARDGITGGDPRRALADIARQAARLSQLITNLLQLSRADEGQLVLEREPLQMATLARDVVASLAPLAEERRIDLVTGQMDPLIVSGDLAQLLLALMNLVDNALTYTPAGGRVVVSLARRISVAELRVQDSGIGIAPEDLPHIFDRFYRADPARRQATGGSGLGLAIVRAIVEAHGGTVRAESAPRAGACFIITLPV